MYQGIIFNYHIAGGIYLRTKKRAKQNLKISINDCVGVCWYYDSETVMFVECDEAKIRLVSLRIEIFRMRKKKHVQE